MNWWTPARIHHSHFQFWCGFLDDEFAQLNGHTEAEEVEDNLPTHAHHNHTSPPPQIFIWIYLYMYTLFYTIVYRYRYVWMCFVYTCVAHRYTRTHIHKHIRAKTHTNIWGGFEKFWAYLLPKIWPNDKTTEFHLKNPFGQLQNISAFP